MTGEADRLTAEARWRASVDAVLKGASFETLIAESRDGLPIGPLYPPSTRVGPGPWRDTTRPFCVVQRIEHPDPGEAARQALLDVQNGATGLTLTFAGHRAARGFGLAGTGDEDLAALLDGIAVEAIHLRLEVPPGQDAPVLDAFVTMLDRRGLAPDSIEVDVGLDPLDATTRVGSHAGPSVDRGGGALLDRVRNWRARGFKTPLVRLDGPVHHEAGASEAQELAAVLSTGVAALRALEPLGLAAAREAIGMTLAADADQIPTIAKFRALRRLWARIEDACGLVPRPVRLHAETAWRILARRDPWTNLLRNTIASAAAILGGADSLTVLPFTSALGLSDAFARRLARNTPLVLLEEAHLGRVADPAAGAGSLESLTDALCQEAWRLFQDLEGRGGIAAALAAGTWQADLATMRARRQADLASGKALMVGVTAFRGAEDDTAPAVMRTAAMQTPPSQQRLPSWREAAAFEDLSTPLPPVPLR